MATNKEPRKKDEVTDITLGRASVLRHFLLLHAVPLAGALALLVLNISGRFWGEVPWVAMLQFVAKAHEMLMQASIGVVTLAYIQLLLWSGKAPYGALFSYYNLSQLTYLCSPEFYAVLTTPAFRGLLKLGFILFIPFSILLATAVGPAAAIALQPRQANFSIPVAYSVLNATEHALFPTTFLTPKPPLPVFPNGSRAGYICKQRHSFQTSTHTTTEPYCADLQQMAFHQLLVGQACAICPTWTLERNLGPPLLPICRSACSADRFGAPLSMYYHDFTQLMSSQRIHIKQARSPA
jgi:hypothetical protein